MYRILSMASVLGVLVFSSASHSFGQVHFNGSAGLNELHVPSEYPTIQAAIDAAVDGDIVIVAPGTYTGDGNRDLDFLSKAITVRSTDPNDPNIVAATIIDCNGSESEPHRGLYFHNDEDANSVLQGLTITNGYADEGGAILCNASNPAVKNCLFFKNNIFVENSYDVRGGAIYCLRSNITIENCVFTGNSASQGGGGLFCYAGSPTITNCTFTENSSYGGGIFNQYGTPTITNCNFIKNYGSLGGGIFNESSNPTITNCIFTENSAVSGGGLFCDSSSPTIANCSFIKNYAEQNGGGIWNWYLSNPMITNCSFTENRAEWDGGGISNWGESNPVISDCIFLRNSASSSDGAGGAISYAEGNSIIINSSIIENTARDGGGVISGGGNLTITNCTFSNNSAYDGGGLYNGVYDSDTNLVVTNCTFSSNSAGYFGGGMSDAFSNTKLTNCTFYANSAQYGGGMMDVYDSTVTAGNCILWADVPQEIYLWAGIVTISHSDVKHGWPGLGNIDIDPCFVDADANDYHLKSAGWRCDTQRKVWTWDDVTSRCIDAGNPGSALADELLSIPDDPNNEWGQNLRINMGAFGGTAEASIPPYDWALLSDITNDGISDLDDLDILSSLWLNTAEQLYADFNRDGIIDLLDFALLAQDWLAQTSWH